MCTVPDVLSVSGDVLTCLSGSFSTSSVLLQGRLSFPAQAGTRPSLALAWEKLDKQEVRRPGTSCLPPNGPLVPSSGALQLTAHLQTIQSLQVQCFGSEFRLTLFLPTTSEQIQTQ